MAIFAGNSKKMSKCKTVINNEFMTPKSAWENIKQYIPRDKVIWESFKGDGSSAQHLRDLSFNVISTDEDFFDCNYGDVIVSNPPFSKIKEIIPRLIEIDKPFILIMPSQKLFTSYMRVLKDKIQIIIPRSRIRFNKLAEDGSYEKYSTAIDCLYYCYKINLKNDITWIE
tara:strand:+ start:30 stop:539 length:510 start_codon:yes stop_codon:yes gene_type:complete